MESSATLASLAAISTFANIDNKLVNLIGAYNRSDCIFPVSGDVIAMFKAARA